MTQSKIGSGCIVWAIFFAFLAGATASGGFAVLAIVSFAIWLLYFFTQSNWAIQQKAANYLRSLESSQIYNGHEFEHFIAQKLRDNGMTATVTPGSGDQGVDILAKTRRGTRIAIQTKLYSRSVTNKAVQEVHAGKVYYNCSFGFV